MSAITYPTTLPAPSRWVGVPLERRAVSSLPGNTQHRARSRDALQDIEAKWFYTAPEMAIWRAWYEQTLRNGMFWFAATSPGAGGWVARVFRHRTKSIKCELLGNGVYTVSAQLQQRGLSAAPSGEPAPTYLFLDRFNGTGGTSLASHAPDIAPSGFVWGTSGITLSGAGSIGATTSGISIGGGFSTTLPAAFSIQITASRPALLVSEAEFFMVGESGAGGEAYVMLRAESFVVQARVFCAGTLRSYVVSAGTHTVRLRVNGDGTASSYVDGAFQETFACAAPALSITHMRVAVDYEPGVIGRVDEVSIFT